MDLSGVALFGGTFNPVHHGHLIVARAVAEHLGVRQVELIPSANPPHKRDNSLADASDRLEMVRRAVAGDPLFAVSDIEVRREGPSFTVLTVQARRESLGAEVPLYWLIGADTLPELHTWYRVRELVGLCRIVTAARPGFETPDLSPVRTTLSPGQVERLLSDVLSTPRIDISATDIRARCRAGASVRYLVPDSVAEYIGQRGLYRAG